MKETIQHIIEVKLSNINPQFISSSSIFIHEFNVMKTEHWQIVVSYRQSSEQKKDDNMQKKDKPIEPLNPRYLPKIPARIKLNNGKKIVIRYIYLCLFLASIFLI